MKPIQKPRIKLLYSLLILLCLPLAQAQTQIQAQNNQEQQQIPAPVQIMPHHTSFTNDYKPLNLIKPANSLNVEITGTEGTLKVPASIVKKPVPHFYGIKIENQAHITAEKQKQNITLTFTKLQGKGKTYSLQLSEKIAKLRLESNQVKHWSIREDLKTKKHYLDIVPTDENANKIIVKLLLEREREAQQTAVNLLTFAAPTTQKSGFYEQVKVEAAANIALQIAKTQGFLPLVTENEEKQLHFLSHSGGSIKLKAISANLHQRPLNLHQPRLIVTVAKDQKSASIQLLATLKVQQKKGGTIPLIQGNLALQNSLLKPNLKITFNNNHSYAKSRHAYTYGIQASKAGDYPLDLTFITKIEELNGWNNLKFRFLNGTVVPMQLHFANAETSNNSTFDNKRSVLPKLKIKSNPAEPTEPKNTTLLAHLPANGQCDTAWKPKEKNKKTTLFFTSKSNVDVTVGGGLLQQTNKLSLKILQGKLNKLSLEKKGKGEITSVTGKQVSHWNIENNGNLNINFTGAYNQIDDIVIESQHALGTFPANMQPVQWTPKNSQRHAGYLRVRNQGAVNIEMQDLQGMMQVTPEQFPSYHRHQKFNQVYVYRFPSKQRNWKLIAKQISPEISIQHLLKYNIGISDRSLEAEINLDVREAALRDWTIKIPHDYAVVTVKGTAVQDYLLSSQVKNEKRALKIAFNKAVLGRELITLHLEKNAPAKVEKWILPQLHYPNVENVRGQIGIAADLGWNITSDKMSQLHEIPLAYFQKNSKTIQQAYRQRKATWSASVNIEKLKQSVQSDVFHLYTVKEGTIDCSAFLNYFIVGAPMREFYIELPKTAENITVTGQNVRSYKRQKNQLIVTLEQPQLGNANLLLKFEQNMKQQNGKIALGQITPKNVQSESGYIQVISPFQVSHKVQQSTKGLLELEESELPAEYRVLSSLPTIAAWQYAARPFQLAIELQWFSPKELVNQSIDFSTLKTEIAKGGRYSTTANFFVKTRGKQSLRLKLPENTELYEVTANKKRINARLNGEEIILPLPAQTDLNNPVEVMLSYGPKTPLSGIMKLDIPQFSAPIVMSDWKISSTDKSYLQPLNGNVSIKNYPSKGTSGLQWISQNPLRCSLLLAAILLFTTMIIQNKTTLNILGRCGILVTGYFLLNLLGRAFRDFKSPETSFEAVAPMTEANTALFIEVRVLENLLKPEGLWLAGIGALWLIASFLNKNLRKWYGQPLGFLALSIGLLLQQAGAIYFLGLLCLLLIYIIFKKMPKTSTGKYKVALLLLTLSLGLSSNAKAQLDSINEHWNITEQRLNGKAQIKWKANIGDKQPLLKAPASLTSFEAPNCRLSKEQKNGITRWYVIAETKGEHKIDINFERPMPQLAKHTWTMVTEQALARKLTVTVDKKHWQTTSPQAVKNSHNYGENNSTSTLILLPGKINLEIQPKKIDPDTVKAQFMVETTDLYQPAPGVLNGLHRIQCKPVQGQLRNLQLTIPKGLMIGEITGKVVNTWSYDLKNQQLNIQLKQAQKKNFSLLISTQQAITSLPAELKLRPLSVEKASQTTGMLGIAFGKDTQPDSINTEHLSFADINDFPALATSHRKNQVKQNLHKVYRYNQSKKANMQLKVAAITPELRAYTNQVLNIGEERFLLNTEANVKITRTGIFNLKWEIPKGFEIESVTGSSLRNYIESENQGKRWLTLHLNQKKMGNLNFRIALSAPATGEKAAWKLPKLKLQNALRQSGELIIMPRQGIQIAAVKRKHVTQQDARQLRKKHHGALKFRLLQTDAELQISIDKLNPWITAELLQEITLRDAQTRNRIGLHYKIEHAAVKEVFVNIPNLSTEEELTVRVAGAQVKGIEKVKDSLWKVSLRRRMIGNFNFELEYQLSNQRKEGKEKITPLKLVNVKQTQHFLAVRANERLDMQPLNQPKGWRKADWKAIPQKLYSLTNKGVPEISYQLLQGEEQLQVQIKRHAMLGTLKLKVKKSELTTLFSEEGTVLNTFDLKVEVMEKSAMSLKLPKEAKLFGVIVNKDTVAVVEKEGAYQFNVSESTSSEKETEIKVIYYYKATAGKSKINLDAPQLNTPLEKILWNVMLPEGKDLISHTGDFEKIESNYFDLIEKGGNYRSQIASFKKDEQQRAAKMMEEVDRYIKKGERSKANDILNLVARNSSVGADMNDDAQDLLKKNQIQHAMMGLNTRRQRMYLYNKTEGNTQQENLALEEAASRNPLFQGKFSYNPNQVKDFMQGMSQEEQQALQDMAAQLVETDLINIATPQAIQVTLPKSGKLIQFERKLQLSEAGNSTLSLTLKESDTNKEGKQKQLFIILGIAILSLLAFTQKKTKTNA